jgi:phosphoribosylformimino-5-aminoimidazole carboxamide ribotide isomerase
MEIIPAIDIIGGQCVRLTQGDYKQMKVYAKYPLDMALQFCDAGIKRLHLVDLDGAKTGKIVNQKTLELLATKTPLIIDFGGGLNSPEDLKIAFDSGAKMVTGGSIAVRDQEMFKEWLRTFGPEKIILGADARNGKIAIKGWQEESQLTIEQLIEMYQPFGIDKIICTDISKDGAMQGPSFDLYKKLMAAFPKQNFIASGGISNFDDVLKLQESGMFGAIIGKAIYEKTITLKQLSSLI